MNDSERTSPAASEIPTSESQWQERLSPEQYHVCRQHGTERAFTGKYWNSKDKGIYRCACCGAELFSSEAKFDSGTGWPSFHTAMSGENVESQIDRSHGMVRTEIHCRRCGAHLGHLFDDGPAPTGMRYCVNSASLDLDREAR